MTDWASFLAIVPAEFFPVCSSSSCSFLCRFGVWLSWLRTSEAIWVHNDHTSISSKEFAATENIFSVMLLLIPCSDLELSSVSTRGMCKLEKEERNFRSKISQIPCNFPLLAGNLGGEGLAPDWASASPLFQ